MDFVFVLGLALALLAVGCAGSRRGDSPDGVPRDALREQPPPFLTGPAAAFLTNLDSYSAAVALTIQPGAAGARVISGQLVERRGKFFFEPAPARSERKRAGADQFSFIWDATAGRGFVLSEALQGYAPFGSATRFGPPAVQPSPPPPADIFQDHPVSAGSAACTNRDGGQATFQLLCARDLNGLALRIETTNGPLPFTLTLSKVRIDRPADGLFQPPPGFTKYESEQALLTELVTREQSLQGSGRERHSLAEPDFPDRTGGSHGGPDDIPANRYGR